MEVVVPTSATDFNFDSTSSSPYITAPSTPKIFAPDFYYFSAPASPTRSASLRLHYHNEVDDDDDDNFAFDFSGQLHPVDLTTAAEDLFEQGRIRPLKPPPLQNTYKTSTTSSSAASPKQVLRKARSPRRRKISLDQKPSTGTSTGTSTSASSSFSSLSSYFKLGSKRWRFKDLLLFRSASEGRAAEKDPLRKYWLLTKRGAGGCGEDVRNASFRSTDSTRSSRRAGAVSAHELHYTMNRAVSEELKRKTFLPYRQGLLGCLGFNPSAHGGLAKGFDSFGRV